MAGRINGLEWTTDVDFEQVDPPGLGETLWTVWNTGNGWVPAKYGYDGPLNNDDHHPILLTGYDEWTIGRSCYGPDALLAYDLEGNFVKCLNSLDLHAPDGREVMVTGEASPRLIYRIYRHGRYSDFAEGYGMYHRLGSKEEIQATLYAVYDLLDGSSLGPTNFQGFVEMYVVGDHAPQDNVWRWGVADTLYAWDSPRSLWAPPGGGYVRSGRGGGGITILSPGAGQGRSGVKGVSRRA